MHDLPPHPAPAPAAPVPDDVIELREQLMALARRMRRPDTGAHVAPAQLQLLSSIDRLGAAASPSALAERDGHRSSNLAALLRQCEQAGLIRRSVDPADRRQVRVRLTGHGQALLEDNRERSARWLAGALQQRLSAEEREQLLRAGALLARLLAQAPLPASASPAAPA